MGPTADDAVARETPLGTVRGFRRHGVETFLGLPYATTPVRFGVPVPAEPWAGTRDATDWGPECPQPVAEQTFGLPGLGRGGFDEDCLRVNVWAPHTAGPHPVIVWIHGGGFTTGSANQNDATALARGADAVVVAINYRLGLLGWLDLSELGPEYSNSADAWLADQVIALEWVRDNVAAFGGDPGRICLVGSSAGAGSVLALSSTPTAQGLFHGAVACSPPAFSPDPRPDLLQKVARKRRTSRARAAQWLRTAPVEDIVALSIAPRMTTTGPLYNTPAPRAIAATGPSSPPLIAGFASNEADFFFGPFETPGGVRGAARNVFFGAMGFVFRRQLTGGLGKAMRYGRRLRGHTGARGRAMADQLITDSFRRASIESVLAATRANGHGYLYEIDLPCTLEDKALRSAHMVDIPLTFNVFDDPEGWDGWTYINDPAGPELADRWVAMLAHFARTGEPGDSLGSWPPYDEADRTSILIRPTGPEVCRDRDGALRRAVWMERS